jgi:potassium channel subfamily K
MNDASGENVDEHVAALEGETDKLQQSMDNDNAHLDPRCVFHDPSLAADIRGGLTHTVVGSLHRHSFP